MAEHGNGIALIFARTETATFFNHVWERAIALRFLRGRVTFHRPDGTLPRNDTGGGQSSAPSVLVAYSEDDACSLLRSSLPGRFVVLR